MFKVMRSGKRQKKQWKRMLTKVTFVGGGFTRKPPKYERFIRPTGAPRSVLELSISQKHVRVGSRVFGTTCIDMCRSVSVALQVSG